MGLSPFLTHRKVGLVEVTNIDSTVSTGTESILAPGAMGFQINPPGVLSFRATIASASQEWAGQTPLFDCLFMSNAQWIAYIDPQMNPGQVGVFGTRVSNCTRLSSVFSTPGSQWIVLDNNANFGTAPPFFSSLTFSYSIAFGGTAVPLPSSPSAPSPTSPPSPSCTAGTANCVCRPALGANPCNAGLACTNNVCVSSSQPTAPTTTGANRTPSPFGATPTPTPFVQPPSPFVGQPVPTPTVFVPPGQIDCSDTAIYPQCLSAIFCQPGQSRQCLCDGSGNVLTKMCAGVALTPMPAAVVFTPSPPSPPPVGQTTMPRDNASPCFANCKDACGDRGVMTCDCSAGGDSPSSFKCGAASVAALSIAAAIAAAAVAMQ
jgi:hypothetical protein